MSESIVRKVQPFTIGTRLSVPSVPKCQEFPQSYMPSESLDNCVIQHNLNSLYLSRSQVCAHGPCPVSPTVKQTAAKENQEDLEAEDHLNQNAASPSTVSRSIKKITISGSKVRSESKKDTGPAKLSIAGFSSENNNNNNNISGTSDPHLPRIVGVSYETKPSSQFKVLLSKDGSAESQAATRAKVNGERSVQISLPDLMKEDTQRKDGYLHTQNKVLAPSTSESDSFTQRNSLFNKEVLQAEAWIKGKLQDLKDGGNIQYHRLQDCEEASQTLQRDLKDFENTLIQLNQTGEQLICKRNPTSDLVKKQLGQLKEQWQTLRQTAMNQTHGAQSLQEFNKKVDKLEAWIKKKEEEQSLVDVLGENVDKMQLTRKILDLKQDEQLHRNLHEEINNLALKLEKQGKTDGKNISSKRKHINKMWLKVQSHLKNYHENLHLALEVASFYQQADNTLIAINQMRKTISASKDLEGFGDKEIRDIGGQIMMLDVSVSQLSNLHPVLASNVTLKQSEVKNGWTLLQRDLREEADLLTSTREAQCNMGAETHVIMGKEVKEERNRLKGCVIIADGEQSRQPQSSHGQEQHSVEQTSPALKDASFCSHDAVIRHQLKWQSTKRSGEPKPGAATQGHPQLHLQLQKFTVCADKTLAWLKDNVSMATQVCAKASYEGLEAAKRCQHALEQEILNNRARIEVVKREGHGLVRAQHPGSTRIEEFLSQLEVLWEELKRRHQRNAAFLQASEELGFRIVKALQALGSLEAWLESVELSMKESALAGDPKTMSVAERESCLLEKEVTARSPELDALRQEVDRLHGHNHPLTRGLPARMEEVERKYHRVLSALTQQSSQLQDTRMLTEFLQRVELEESQEQSSPYSLCQPLQSDISSTPSLFELQSGSCVGETLIETMGDHVEELREAVEMLNDTVRERGRSQSHDRAIQVLLSKHAGLAVRVEETLCCSKDLCLDILEKETDMAMQCEPDRCGVDALQEKQDHLEIECEVMKEDVWEMENQASQLMEVCPERMHLLRGKIQATLSAWDELGKSVSENKSRLQDFVQLQDFFRSYLAMISWTEDTRTCIFSETALHLGRDGQRPLAAELDVQIEQKFEDFDKLSRTGKSLFKKEHHLTQMVRERMEELRSMLGWISVHWRAQKQQRLHKNNRQEPAQDNIYSEAATCSSLPQSFSPELEEAQVTDIFEDKALSVADVCSSLPQSKPTNQRKGKLPEDGYETMNRIGSPSEAPKTNLTVLKENSNPPSSAAVKLIFSFGHPGNSQVQVLDLPGETEKMLEETVEPVHRVSTFLRVKETNLAVTPVYESITFNRQKSHSTGSRSPTLSPSSSPPPSPHQLHTNNTIFHSATNSSSVFSSLKRMGKRRKRKKDVRRHTIQKIMGADERTEGARRRDGVAYETRTWPLKEGLQKNAPELESVAYMKNPLLKDIDKECSGEYSITPYAVSVAAASSPGQVKGHCRFLSLGSVLSFDLPKDMSLIPSIQDIITIAPSECKKGGADPDLLSQRANTVMSSFRQTRPTQNVSQTMAEIPPFESKQPAAGINELFDVEKCARPPQTVPSEDENIVSDSKSSPGETERKLQLPVYVNQTSTCAKHECLSVHTLIRDLNGHKYHRCMKSHGERSGVPSSQSPHVRVNLKSTMSVSIRQDSVDSGISTSSGIKLSAGRLVSLQAGGADSARSRENTNPPSPSPNSTESVHLDRQQFEEEEEELEDIWNRTSSYRQSICSDIMYQSNQDESTAPNRNEEPPSSPAVLYRNLVTASAPNLPVVEFKLPSHIQSSLGAKDPLVAGDRRSWAAFPNREPTSKTLLMANETAADPVKLPDIGDTQRYFYQYKEEEEEEEVGEEVEEHTGLLKDPSISLHTCSETVSCSLRDLDKSTEEMATGGRCFILSGKPELQSMEGTLERKHKLQLGGKKAASRGWNSYHTILHRHTLCFFQDRKETLRSSACGLPLNLFGAECSPAPDYTKKPNCFRLRLRDGSEYLFNASSRFLMKKWIMKIQSSSCHSESVSTASNISADQDLMVSLKPSMCFRCSSQTSCCCSSRHDVTHTVPRHKPPSITQTSEIVLSKKHSHVQKSHLKSLSEQLDVSPSDSGGCDYNEVGLKQSASHRCPERFRDDSSPCPHPPVFSSSDWHGSKHRSHSFTSATYQKIKPALQGPGGKTLEKGSNYSVTLVVGDNPNGSSSIIRSSEPPLLAFAGWQQDSYGDSSVRSYLSLPRPRNKSVFKKFFGK